MDNIIVKFIAELLLNKHKIMKIETEQKILLLRYSNYKNFNFIIEHEKIDERDHSVWMLKLGRQIPEPRLHEILSGSRQLILRGAKSDGSRYYVSKLLDAYNGLPNQNMNYPKYYELLPRDEKLWMVNSLMGTWLKIHCFSELSQDKISHLKLYTNDEPVQKVLETTRSAILYVKYDGPFSKG